MLVHKSAQGMVPDRVVVLGARGFVAGALVAALARHGIPCRAVARSEVDLTDSSAADRLSRIFQPGDAIVLVSALTPEHGRDRGTFLKNVNIADHVCDALSSTDFAHVVYISSDSIYRQQSDPVTEKSCCEPSDMYGLSHLAREMLLTEACRAAGRPLAILRPGAIYGAADTHNSYGPNRFLRSAVREGRIALFGGGEELRDHVPISDVVNVIQLCLRHCSAGVLNVVSGKAMSFAEVASEVIAAVGCPVSIDSQPRRVEITHRRFNAAAVKAAFPEFQATPFSQGIRQALSDLRSAIDADRAGLLSENTVGDNV